MAAVSTEELKNRVSIVEIVGGYVALKKAGRDFKGLCPFHDDKNPSLHVSDEKGMFHCFSCKAGGDVFEFVRRINGATFPEAVREVAGKAGVEVKMFQGKKDTGTEEILNMNRAVAGFFRKRLTADGNAESKKALAYLRARGVNAGIEEEFSLGYAPVSPAALPKFLEENGFSIKRAMDAGLVASGNGRTYGKFRGRLMFPIVSPDSRVIGFGGRILDPSERAPKYLNSADSAVYRKRGSLYGLNNTRQEIRKSGLCVLVEGYMDLLSVCAAGVKNTAASLGTSLTREHVALIRRYAEDVVILYDGDRAGTDASFTAGEVFMAHGIVPRIARVPDGLDPDSFVSGKGAGALRAVIEDAPVLTEVLMDDMAAALRKNTISETIAAKRLMSIVPALGKSPAVGPYVTEVSKRFGFREGDLYSMAKSAAPAPRPHARKGEKQPEVQAGTAEMMLLRIALKFPRVAEFLSSEEVAGLIPDGEVKTLVSSMSASGMGAPRQSSGSQLLSHAHFTLDEIDFMDETNVTVEIEKCLMKLKLEAIGRELKAVRERLRVFESEGGGGGRDLMKRYKELLDEKQRLIAGDLSQA